MLKDSEISRSTNRRTHRTYTPEFKAQLVAACQLPGASIAALAGLHGMNANVLHRWLKEHQRCGSHQLVEAGMHAAADVPSRSPAFIPLTLPPAPKEQGVKIELRKGALSMVITWPLSAGADLASWTSAILK
jgi:transposase-like protein